MMKDYMHNLYNMFRKHSDKIHEDKYKEDKDDFDGFEFEFTPEDGWAWEDEMFTMYKDSEGNFSTTKQPKFIVPEVHETKELRWFNGDIGKYNAYLEIESTKKRFWAVLDKLPTEDAILLSETINY